MRKKLSNPIPRKILQEYACNFNNLGGIMKNAHNNSFVSPLYRQPIANRVSTPKTLTEIQRISITMNKEY